MISLYRYVLADIVSFSGLFAGIVLAKYIAPEEVKPGKNYAGAVCNVLIFSVIGFLGVYYSILPHGEMYAVMGITALAGAFFYFTKQESIIYASLGSLFFLSRHDLFLFFAAASLIFLYGIPYALRTSISDASARKKGRGTCALLLKTFTRHALFFVSSIGLFAVNLFF
ncbi:hypothetical protein COY95_00715 [Candidatus Woesearchaeota archaeon CG_4_10_14_0_8_um_filter_47_5]|nr:MAG: hypothetical protein COY95_00715 [Candidatus Woesearchaeota archaeon CG_4_10_14_0_8_um_filter_47_5]